MACPITWVRRREVGGNNTLLSSLGVMVPSWHVVVESCFLTYLHAPELLRCFLRDMPREKWTLDGIASVPMQRWHEWRAEATGKLCDQKQVRSSPGANLHSMTRGCH